MRINVLEYFNESVKKHPSKIAVVEGEATLDFQTLFAKSTQLAQKIIDLADTTNRPIAVYLPKGIQNVIANMGITYSGNIYMNLDTKTPPERIKNILNTIDPVAIITNQSLTGAVQSCFTNNIPLIQIESTEATHPNLEKINTRLEKLIDTDPYCIINTSGSTGTPKGVVLHHKSFIDFIEWSTGTLQIGKDEIIGSLSPNVFDIYSYELCLLMAKGSTLVLLPDHLAAFPYKILEILKAKQVTYLFWVPTIMVNIANMDLLSKIDLPSLKKIWFAGEVFPTKQFNYWHQFFPDAQFVNLYGPIEITLDCTYYVVNRKFSDEEPLPIGFPCKNTSLLILNEEGHLCQHDEEGELCVRGTSLAMGYYNNWEKTATAFTQNPLNKCYPELIYRTGDIVTQKSNGEIYFKGRKDTLVKHSGYRIELAEIEHVVVNTIQIVSNGCALYDFTKKEIVFVYEADKEIPPATLRKKISEVLPKYMVPTRYIHLETIPMNTNGKIDRLALKFHVAHE